MAVTDMAVTDMAEPDLAAEHERLLQFLYVCPHGLAQFDRDGRIVMLNPAFACLVMPLLAPGAVFGNLIELLEPCLPELRSLLRRPLVRGSICDGVRVHLGPAAAGQDPRVLALTVVRMDADRHMAVLSDLSRQVAQERRLQESEAWFAAVVQGADDYAILGVDPDGTIRDWNLSGERLFGYSRAQAVGRHASAVTGSGPPDPQAFRARLREAGSDGWHLDDGWCSRADGSRFWGTSMVSPVDVDRPVDGLPVDRPGGGPPGGGPPVGGPGGGRVDGRVDGTADPAPTRYLMVVRDVTERRHTVEELRRTLTADYLTGTLNRRSFLDRAERELLRQARQRTPCCVAIVDADHFKAVNDTFGHAAGDLALCAIAAVLRAQTRDSDLVGRLGGEEFAVLMPAIDADDAVRAAERLRAGVAALRLRHEDRAIALSVSIGVAVMPGGDAGAGADLKQLLADADAALYQAKHAGRDRVCRAGRAPPP